MDIATIIGLVSVFTLILLAMGDAVLFVDIPSLLIVVGGTISLTLMSFPLGDVVALPGYILHAFFPYRSNGEREKVVREMEKGIFMLGGIKTHAQVTGWLGVIIGAIIMLKHMDDPTKIGPGAALSLLTAFYGIILAYVLCGPLRTKLEAFLGALEKGDTWPFGDQESN